MKPVKLFKKMFSILAGTAVLAAIVSPTQAATLLVDNNPHHQADYTTLQAAIDAASAGDTILVGPSYSNTSYGAGLVEKQLFIYGTGYLLKENGFNNIDFPSRTDAIILKIKKDVSNNPVSNPSGTVITGLKAGSISITNVHSPDYVNGTNVIANVVISRNRTSLYVDSGDTWDNNDYTSNLHVTNNYLSTLNISSNNSATVNNNIIESIVYID